MSQRSDYAGPDNSRPRNRGRTGDSAMNDNMNEAQQETDAVVVEESPKPEAAPAIPETDIQAGKTFAILSYALSFVGLPFFVIPLITRDNDFALYHAKQSLIIWLAGLALGVASGLLTLICIGPILGLIGMIALLAFNIIGLINAIKNQPKPVPLIGQWGEDWFKSITKIVKS